jgi:hypothetical protein
METVRYEEILKINFIEQLQNDQFYNKRYMKQVEVLDFILKYRYIVRPSRAV